MPVPGLSSSSRGTFLSTSGSSLLTWGHRCHWVIARFERDRDGQPSFTVLGPQQLFSDYLLNLDPTSTVAPSVKYQSTCSFSESFPFVWQQGRQHVVPNTCGCHHCFLPLSHLGHFSVLSPLPPNPRDRVIFFSLSQLLPNGKSPSPCSQNTHTHIYTIHTFPAHAKNFFAIYSEEPT